MRGRRFIALGRKHNLLTRLEGVDLLMQESLSMGFSQGLHQVETGHGRGPAGQAHEGPQPYRGQLLRP